MFYEQFSTLCKAHNVKETSLARDLGLGAAAPGRWKKGASPDLVNAKKIADYFGVTLDYLVNGTDSAGNSIGNVSNSNVLQDVSGDNIHVGGSAGTLTDSEQQILELYRTLDLKRRTQLMMRAIELQEEMAAK